MDESGHDMPGILLPGPRQPAATHADHTAARFGYGQCAFRAWPGVASVNEDERCEISSKVGDTAIWHLTPSPSLTEGSVLRFYDFASRTTRTVYRTERPVAPGMTIAPDGRRLLFSQHDRSGSGLMLIENFR